ncbi:hypothetical protein B0T18DRAFT_391923 [Schizothecium vesticola]|uniref:Infection structure specific protein n=1 Tax=Schizothecium vesticola TaxID=314040 RepID=A0AA40EPF5_9PEZI|nr:hypothetical protein B0T18DRAFT_391923 [Schizothecium vesticola]
MLSKAALLAILPALVASSQILHPHAHQPHQARQTNAADATACLGEIEAAASFPMLPKELVGLTDIKPIINPCDYTPPVAMAAAFSSFEKDLLSWVSGSWPKVTSALSKCPSLSSEVEGFARAWDQIVCTDKNGSGPTATSNGGVQPTGNPDGSQTTGAGSATTVTALTGSQTTNTAGSATSQGTKSAGMARETGFVAGVIAVAGFVGAVVAL